MATPKGKPRGYFEKFLAFDCETTGLCFSNDSPVYNERTNERHQAVSWGIIIADAQKLVPIEELYVEVKWNHDSKQQRSENPNFGKKAEKIHGLTFNYLEQNGVTEQEAVEQIGTLLLSHFGPSSPIKTLGHNSITFDLMFFRDMFHRYGIDLNFGNRHYCTNSMGFCALGVYNSDDLFDQLGVGDRDPNKHNALDDARMALETCRRLRLIFQKVLK